MLPPSALCPLPSFWQIDTDYASNLIHAKVEHLSFLEQEVRHKKIAEQLSGKLLQ